MYKVIILFAILGCVCGKVCDVNDTVDITGGRSTASRIAYGGIIFEEYFNEDGKVKACLVPKGLMVSKCCPAGAAYDSENSACESITSENQKRSPLVYVEKIFNFEFGKPDCSADDAKVRITAGHVYDIFNIGEDGKLYVEIPTSVKPWTVFTPDMYCIDSFVSEVEGKQISRLDALVCFDPQPDEENYIPGIICMLISCVFIIVTVAVYYCLPELCNLHGKVLIAYLLSLFVGFIFLSTMQILLSIDNISREYCMTFTFIIYYFILAAFFWLNVMSFDIWWTFSGNRGISIERMSVKSRFRAYSIYAFGVPALFTALVAGLEFSHLPLNWYLPLLRQQGCFISGKSKLIYLYGPMVILCVANLVFFILTALKIREIKEQTAVLKSRESATHDKHNKDKQRLLLYVKLFIVMGINWVLEVISALYPKANSIWKFTDAYNVLVGLIIFILFVCKKKIFRLLKNRIKEKVHRRDTELRSTVRTVGSRSNINMDQKRTSLESIRTSNGGVQTTVI
ncbi:probable G-protein coupled receptor Mth-like 3 isoform X8 [Pieris napi]|uniref:probable G-protein coupled receptor Mth-like 3 isoform X8 n=1 Tax=Pieris napi TaxID=78633 RepID=UPI001FB96F72|nr:probable G-protein coupled receptor Mth-like 3 isoform X8 [Pieris napi]